MSKRTEERNRTEDRLESFVAGHREEFDVREPDPSLWLKIDTGRPDRSAHGRTDRSAHDMPDRSASGTLPRWLRIAAAVALIFAGSTAGLHYLTSGNSAGSDAYSSELYREIRETELYYSRMVSDRYTELEPFLASDPGAREMLRTDMDELDRAYAELKEDLQDNVANPEVIEAMILNYRVKLEILEDLLDQLKGKENQDDETNGSYSL